MVLEHWGRRELERELELERCQAWQRAGGDLLAICFDVGVGESGGNGGRSCGAGNDCDRLVRRWSYHRLFRVDAIEDGRGEGDCE